MYGGLHRLVGPFATLLFSLAACGAVHADILVVDLDDSGDALIKRDTATGLDWLSLSATAEPPYGPASYTVNDILGGGGGFLGRGFRYATEAEVLEYRDHIEAQAESVSNDFSEYVAALAALLPTTNSFGMGNHSLGAYDDGGTPLFYGSAGWDTTVQVPVPTFRNISDVVYVAALDFPVHAHWLHRPTPSPVAVPVMGRGALLLLVSAFTVVGAASATSRARRGDEEENDDGH